VYHFLSIENTLFVDMIFIIIHKCRWKNLKKIQTSEEKGNSNL